MNARQRLLLACALLLVSGCETSSVEGSVYLGVGYYDDPWYWGPDTWVPPADGIGPPPPRPEHPIARPPPARPAQPIAPAPRPMPMPRGRR